MTIQEHKDKARQELDAAEKAVEEARIEAVAGARRLIQMLDSYKRESYCHGTVREATILLDRFHVAYLHRIQAHDWHKQVESLSDQMERKS